MDRRRRLDAHGEEVMRCCAAVLLVALSSCLPPRRYQPTPAPGYAADPAIDYSLPPGERQALINSLLGTRMALVAMRPQATDPAMIESIRLQIEAVDFQLRAQGYAPR